MSNPFSNESQRYDYPLTASSTVLDVGAYVGAFSEGIHEKYKCKVVAFEPVKRYFEVARLKSVGRPGTAVYNMGVGPADAQLEMAVAGDWSSLHLLDKTNEHEVVEIRDVSRVFYELLGGAHVGLMKINIEGAEYALLEAMLERGLLEHVDYLQVQFHTYGAGEDGPIARRNKIRERLAASFNEQWCSDFIWESWGRR